MHLLRFTLKLKSIFMKFYLFSIAIIFCCQLTAQSYSYSQKTLVTKRTATWCPNCGTWGWDFAKAIEELENENIVLMRAHYSGDLKSDVAEEITKNFNAQYQPEFYLNEVRQSVGSSTWSDKVSEFDEIVNEKAKSEPNVIFELSSMFEDGALDVLYKVRFIKEITGEFYVAGYVLEDGVINNQASLGAEAVHNKVIRVVLGGETFGALVSEDEMQLGASASFEHTYAIDGEDLSSKAYAVLLIVWKKVDGVFVVENVHSAPIGASTSAKEEVEELSLNVIQKNDKIFVSGDLVTDGFSTISISSLDGRLLSQKRMRSGSNSSYYIDIPQSLEMNTYVITVRSNENGILYS